MYLSPGVAPPTCAPSPRSYPPRSGDVVLSFSLLFLCHSSASVPPSSFCFHLLPFAFVLEPLLRAVSFSPHLYTQRRRVTPTRELTRSFHVPLRINSRLFLSSFFAPSPTATPSCAWRCSSIALAGHQRTPNDVTSKPPSSRRIVAPRRFFARPTTSPLAYCFREFDEILPRDANGPPCTFFDTTVGHSELN